MFETWHSVSSFTTRFSIEIRRAQCILHIILTQFASDVHFHLTNQTYELRCISRVHFQHVPSMIIFSGTETFFHFLTQCLRFQHFLKFNFIKENVFLLTFNPTVHIQDFNANELKTNFYCFYFVYKCRIFYFQQCL